MGQMTGRDVDLNKLRQHVIETDKHPEKLVTARGGKVLSSFDHFLGEMACSGLAALGKQAGIRFDFNVQFAWHPVDAQRLLLWAHDRGCAELCAEALAVLHFEQATGSCSRETVLHAAEKAGMDRAQVLKFLESDEREQEVWDSYGKMVQEYGIHSIPLFVFNGPCSSGGPFRPKLNDCPRAPRVLNGSGGCDEFVAIFEAILSESESKL